jgi:hypothetical protein
VNSKAATEHAHPTDGLRNVRKAGGSLESRTTTAFFSGGGGKSNPRKVPFEPVVALNLTARIRRG